MGLNGGPTAPPHSKNLYPSPSPCPGSPHYPTLPPGPSLTAHPGEEPDLPTQGSGLHASPGGPGHWLLEEQLPASRTIGHHHLWVSPLTTRLPVPMICSLGTSSTWPPIPGGHAHGSPLPINILHREEGILSVMGGGGALLGRERVAGVSYLVRKQERSLFVGEGGGLSDVKGIKTVVLRCVCSECWG